jgi:light-regulated signal transduction histidine kinase (bacteriophytochrome)
MQDSSLSKADTAAQELKDFVYIVSHDFSAPLRGIVEFSKLLKTEQREALNDEGKEYLSLIIESGEKLQNMLAGLLEYSRLNTASKPLSMVDCNDILNNCRSTLQDKITTTGAQIDIAQLPTVAAEPEKLTRLFLALLDNALKFHAAGVAPYISVSAEKQDKSWLFTVRDNGIGIDQEFHKRIFQPFQRLHADKEYPGIGMGLTLVKKIVGQQGGEIWINPAAGQGSAFMFTLPHREG